MMELSKIIINTTPVIDFMDSNGINDGIRMMVSVILLLAVAAFCLYTRWYEQQHLDELYGRSMNAGVYDAASDDAKYEYAKSSELKTAEQIAVDAYSVEDNDEIL